MRTGRLLASLTLALPLLLWDLSTGHAIGAQPVPVAAQAPPADDHSDMPNAPGKDITIKTCTKCHSITNITGNHKSKDDWTATVTKMVGYGATGTDDEFEAILNYISKYYGLDPAPPAAHSRLDSSRHGAAQVALGVTRHASGLPASFRGKSASFGL